MIYRARIWKWLVIAGLFLTAVMASGSTMAQDEATEIAIGDTVEGTITESEYQQLYVLTIKAGETVEIAMIAEDDLDPYLLLQDADEETLIEDDDSAGDHNARIAFTFEAAGEYTIVATRFGQSSGSSTGDYTLTVKAGSKATTTGETTTGSTPRPTAAATGEPTEEPTEESTAEVTAIAQATEEPTEEGDEEPTPTRRATATRVRATPTEEETEEATEETPEEEESPTPRATRRATATRRPTRAAATPTPDVIVRGGEITLDEPVTGEIDDSQVFYLYDYEGTEGEELTITVEAEGGLAPAVVFSPNNLNEPPIKSAFARGGETTLTLQVTVPEDGSYFILVSRVGDLKGDSSGSFTLTVTAGSTANVEEVDVTGSPARVITNLRDAGLVPAGGRQIATLPSNSFTRASTPGLKFLPIMGRTAAQNIVLQFQVGWTTAGEGSGCGMGFRKASNEEYAFVLLTSNNKVALYQWDGDQNVIEYFEDSDLFSPGQFNTVTVIAIEDTITIYVNGKLQTSQEGQAVRGMFSLQMFNPEGNTQITNCRFPTGWVWSFDR
jgi:hypothetical protein